MHLDGSSFMDVHLKGRRKKEAGRKKSVLHEQCYIINQKSSTSNHEGLDIRADSRMKEGYER